MFAWVVFDLIRPSVVKEGVGRARSEESEPTQTSSAKQTNSVGKISKTINQGNPWNRLKTWNQTCAFFWVFVKFKFSGWWLMVDAIHVPGMSLQWISCRQVYRNIEGSSKWEKKKSLVTHPSHEWWILMAWLGTYREFFLNCPFLIQLNLGVKGNSHASLAGTSRDGPELLPVISFQYFSSKEIQT